MEEAIKRVDRILTEGQLPLYHPIRNHDRHHPMRVPDKAGRLLLEGMDETNQILTGKDFSEPEA